MIKGLSLGNFFLFLMPTYMIAYKGRFGRASFVLALMAYLFNIYISSARSSLFLSALIAFYYWLLPRNIGVKVAVRIAVMLLVLFYGFALIGEVVGKATEELGVVVYVAAPLHAFDQMLNAPNVLDGYVLSFFPIQGILGSIFGFTPSTELPNVLTPLPTNVYSMFGVYFSDFGIYGLCLAMFFIGLLSGTLDCLYRKTGDGMIRAWVAINLAILSLSIFYDYYTTSGVVWMSILLSPFFFSRQSGMSHSERHDAGKGGQGDMQSMLSV